MKITHKINQGQVLLAFKDHCEAECNIQKSSLESLNAIWIGPGGSDLTPEELTLTTRMLLDQDQVETLIPILQRFVDTGELDDNE